MMDGTVKIRGWRPEDGEKAEDNGECDDWKVIKAWIEVLEGRCLGYFG
jgi:hypothetical protein